MIELLYQALAEPLGIKIPECSPEELRQELYRLRRELKDPKLDQLSFVMSKTDPNTLLIVRRPDAPET